MAREDAWFGLAAVALAATAISYATCAKRRPPPTETPDPAQPAEPTERDETPAEPAGR